jgi:hypothetical protein
MEPEVAERDLMARADQVGWRVSIIEPTADMPFGAKRYYLAPAQGAADTVPDKPIFISVDELEDAVADLEKQAGPGSVTA